ncbi:hypothetical protein [Saccharothrix xinjiangensis]|uniref:Uncharacterized protein n=1 Tax=Saccharothrix xinjiangensis TaxID=204798 RepID=A0ABV9XU28_9PSEU
MPEPFDARLSFALSTEPADHLGVMRFGRHDVDRVAHYDVQRHGGARYRDEDAAHLDLWATPARSCGRWWPREDVCAVTERPAAVHVERVPGESRVDCRPRRGYTLRRT